MICLTRLHLPLGHACAHVILGPYTGNFQLHKKIGNVAKSCSMVNYISGNSPSAPRPCYISNIIYIYVP